MIIDTDLHIHYGHFSALQKYLPAHYKDRGLPICGNMWKSPISVDRLDSIPVHGTAGSDINFIRSQLLDKYNIKAAIANDSTLLELGVLPDVAWAEAVATAANDWLINEFLPQDKRLYGSLIITPQDPAAAIRQIKRHGKDPRIVQIIFCSGARIPYGNRFYWPIYEAALEANLKIAIHVGTEGRGLAPLPTAAGAPSTYFEWRSLMSTSLMGHMASFICDGALATFPELQIAFLEGGVLWMLTIISHLDKNWPSLRMQTPWLKDLPSKYIPKHFRLSTQPLEDFASPEFLSTILKMIHADKTLMFGSDYPHWDADNPMSTAARLPENIKENVMFSTAQEFYGTKIKL